MTTGEARRAIRSAIPHREPFLFVDEVVDHGSEHVSTRWRVPADGPWFPGHFPGEPVLPGVLTSEHCFQSGALLISLLRGGLDPADGVPVLTRIEGARFKRIVRPGELLETRVELRERLGDAYYLTGHVRCGGRTVLRTRFVLSSTTLPSEGAG